MRKANVKRGRIEEHGSPTGTLNQDSVQERAREVAVTNGRRAEEFNEADLAQAREELQGAHSPPLDANTEEEEQFTPREGPIGVSAGRKAGLRGTTDEQMATANLVEEGVEEAAHERMVEGNRESRRRDENFDDQLPSAST